MKDKVAFEVTYPHPLERVWKALTDSEALGQWLMPTDFKPLIGFRFRLNRPGGSTVEGKVIEVEEGRRLAYTWRDDEEGQPSIIVWTLEPKDGGTRVRLEHLAIEEPTVTCIAIDNYFNWLYALRHSLPGLLRLLAAGAGRMPRPPIVYVDESPQPESKRRRIKEKVSK